jgi:hypothetical protein
MHSIQHNLDCAQMMAEELETYLLSDELFWYLPEGSVKKPPCPALTLGGLWLILDELKVQEVEMQKEDLNRYKEISRTIEGFQNQWAVAWEKKAVKELSSRQHLWRAFLTDVEQGKAERSRYTSEVKNRVIASYATRESSKQPGSKASQDKLRALDSRLRTMFESGQFVWDEPLQPMYPKDEFWFLYGELKEPPDHS